MEASRGVLFVFILIAAWSHRCCGDSAKVQTVLETITSTITDCTLKISDQLKQLVSESSEYDLITDKILDAIQYLHTGSELARELNDLRIQFEKINRKFTSWKEYKNKTISNFTLNNLATKCVSIDDDAVPETLKKIHLMIKPDRDNHKDKNLLALIAEDFKERMATHCSEEQSQQYLVSSLLNHIWIAEIRGFVMMRLSYDVLTLLGQGNFTTEVQLAWTNFGTRMRETDDAFRMAMSTASTDLWRCDPPEWNGNDTYVELRMDPFDYFSTTDAVAAIKSNMVVTGIRFVKEKRAICLQVEQGRLLGNGTIAANTTKWVELREKEGEAYSSFYGADPNLSALILIKQSGIDLPIDLDLDDVTAKPGRCLTGVRLRTKNLHLRLEIRTTPFIFATGRLIEPLGQSRWHGNDDTTQKTRVQLKNRNRSITLSKRRSINNFGTNQYVEFGLTDQKEHGGQSIVPFVDTQPVLPSPRVALGGAGIFHKGRGGYGGFIAPKLKTYNLLLGSHLTTDSDA